MLYQRLTSEPRPISALMPTHRARPTVRRGVCRGVLHMAMHTLPTDKTPSGRPAE